MTPVVAHEGPTFRFRGFAPAPPLDRYVELVWLVDGEPDVARERVLPNGVVELIVNFGAPHYVLDAAGPGRHARFRDAWLAGIQSRWLDIRAEADASLLGVRFRPGGAAPLLDLPMDALRDRVLDVRDLEGGARDLAREVHARAAAAPDDAGRLAAAHAVLLARLARARPREGRVSRACAAMIAGERATVAQLAARLGVTHKHLIDLFAREVGLPPKTYARVARFHAVVQALDAAPRAGLAAIAHAAGYTDQAHLAGDFRAFAGTTATAYLGRRSVDPNHLWLER